MKSLFVFILGFSLAAGATPSVNDKIIGLVEMPGFFGVMDPNGPPGTLAATTKSVKLFAEASEKAALVATINKTEDIESREHSYEESSAVVYKEEKGWYQVRTKGKSAWLRPADAGPFRSYEKLIQESMTYLNDSWNRQLYEKPGDKKYTEIKGKRAKTPEDPNPAEDFDVNVLRTQKVNNELWIEVQLIDGRCAGEEKPTKKGWVPAYNSKNKENLWFSSRGC